MSKWILFAFILSFATSPAMAQFRIVSGVGSDSANAQTDDVIAWQTVSGGMGVTEDLYPCNSIGKSLTVADAAGYASSANPITLVPSGSDTINGMTTYPINSSFGSATLLCSGSGTWTIPGPAPALNPVTYLNILNFGAKGDAIWGATDCYFFTDIHHVLHNNMVQCDSRAYSSADTTKTIVIDDAKENTDCLHPAPFVTTIQSVSMGIATIAASADCAFAAPISHITTFDIYQSNYGAGYAFGSTQTTVCSMPCSAITLATGSPVLMTAVNAMTDVAAAGSGGSADGGGPTGSCTVTAAGQAALAGQPSQFIVHLTGGMIDGITATPSRGGYITNDSASYSAGFYTEPVTGCGGLSGAYILLSYGIMLERVTPGTGLYSALPGGYCKGPVQTVTTPDSGGLELTCSSYSSTTSWGTDNAGAFEAAIGLTTTPAPGTMNYDSAHATPACIYIPGGNYLTTIFNTTTNTSSWMAKGYGCWLGDERYHSNVFMVPNQTGDLFSWLDSNENGSLPDFANTQTFSANSHGNQAGSSFRNITIIGNRASTVNQNALTFYGRTRFAYIDNCTVSYVPGIAFSAGQLDSPGGQGVFEESRVENCHFDHDGDGNAGLPAFDITSNNTSGSDNLDLVDLRFYQNLGPSMWIHTGDPPGSGTPNNAHDIRLANIKIEGSGVSKANLAWGEQDLLKFGDATKTAMNVSEVQCRNVQLVNPVLGSAALHVTGESASLTRYFDCDGSIEGTPGGGYGMGLEVDACAQCTFKEGRNDTSDYDFVVGASIASPGIIYDGSGAESLLTTNINPASASLVQFPARQLYAYSNATGLDANRALAAEPLISYISSTTGLTFSVGGSSPVFMIAPDAPLWTVIRTGPATANFTDIWDSANNIEAKLGGGSIAFVKVGQVYHARICNQTSQKETIIPGGGITISPVPQTIVAGQCANFSLAITALSPSAAITILQGL